MAGSEGSVGGQTELLTGWSCVIHRPSEDPEPSSLPSTVDIAAFSSGPSVEPTHSPQNDCCSNSDSDSGSDSENSVSDASGSCSYSSSDTDSSSSSQASSVSSINPPHFSVTSSQTDGLRLTIATVRKSCSSPTFKDETSQSSDQAKGSTDKPTDSTATKSSNAKVTDTTENSINSVIKHLPSPKLSSSDSESDCSDSEESSSNSESPCTVKSNNSERKTVPLRRNSPATTRAKCLRKFSAKTNSNKPSESSKTDSAKRTVRQREVVSKVSPRCPPRGRGRPPLRGNKMAALPLARMSSPNASSSDGEESDSDTNSAILHAASYSLQEIRQEDLAAILPDQQDCDAFGGFECEARNEKPDADVGDGSGSDMELPTQLVNAAIQRVTESSSETESQPAIYASTLLQQFVQQTQLLNNAPLTSSGGTSSLCATDVLDRQSSSNAHGAADTQTGNDSAKGETLKRKRGRPRKNVSKKSSDSAGLVSDCNNGQAPCNTGLLNGEYCGEPNVSPDSGIQNSPDHLSSPEPSPSPNVKTKGERDCGKSRTAMNGKLKSKAPVANGSKLNGNKSSSKSNKNETFNQKVVQKQKISVTCNNLDRVLYANADRVLYPPRRKVGRPATKSGVRKPGRPPKHRQPLTAGDTVHSNGAAVSNENVVTENVETPMMNRYKHNSSSGSSSVDKGASTRAKQSSECSKKVQNVSNNRSATTKGVHKVDTKKSKKVHRSLSDNDIVQLTSNTLSLSLGKSSDLNVSDISDTNVNSVPKKNKSSGALLSEICERVSKRLEFNPKYIQSGSTKAVLQSTASDENTSKSNTTIHTTTKNHHHKVLHVVKHARSVAYLKNKAKLNALRSKLTTFKHMKVMHTKHKHKKHKKHKIKILKTIAAQSSIPKVDTDIDKLILDFVKYCNLGTNKSQKENLPEMFRCVKRLSKKRKGLENTDGRKKKKQCNTNSGENKETNSNEQRLPLKKRHYHMSGNNEHKSATTTTTNTTNPTVEVANVCKEDATVATVPKSACDVKNTTKNGVVNNNKGTSIVTAKCITDKVKSALTSTSNKEQNASVDVKIDTQPNKSPAQHTVNNKSVLVMNKNHSNAVSKSSTANNNNVYNMRKNLDADVLVGVHIDEAIEACITRYTSVPVKAAPNHVAKQINETSEKPATEVRRPVSNSMTATTPKKRHRLETQNIENCANQQLEKVTKKLDGALNNAKTSDNSTDTIVTPEIKSNSMENVVTELKGKKNSTDPPPAEPVVSNKKPNDKKIETVAQMITRKKNRLEDLASNLVSKMNTSAATEALDTLLTSNQKKTGSKKIEEEPIHEISTRASVIKSPVQRKVKAADSDKLLDSIVVDKPTGIFLQTVDLELHIPATTIQTVQSSPKIEVQKGVPSADRVVDTNQHNLRNKKHIEPTESQTNANASSPSTTRSNTASAANKSRKSRLMKEVVVQVEKLKESDLPTDKANSAVPPPSDSNKVVTVLKKKIRRRKAINRTGFPTLKKKKKKIVIVNKSLKTEYKELPGIESECNIYDRVPRIGEEASTFMKRTQNCTLSVVSLEKLQAKPESIPSSNESDIVSKWEVSSECDSLPLDECTFTSELESVKSVKSERPLSRLDIKQERMSLRLRDVSPATSVETRSSDRAKKKTRDLTPDVKPGVHRDDTGDNSKGDERIRHRTRDSSAGSVQTLNDACEYDKRMKRKRDTSSDKCEKKKKTLEDINFKKRLRDLSPASSIEPLPSDKKQRSESVASSSGDDTKRSKKVPRWRKKFLVAGLFSDYYKEDDESVRARRESASNKTRITYNPIEHPYGLLPPPYHCGKYLRCRKVPFQLSHDLWWQHTHSQLPGRDLVPSWNYRKIRTNVYCVRAPSGACEPQACNCSISSGCEDDCINRLVLAECPSTHRCRNQRIQRHEWSPGLEKFMTDNKGWGVRTKMSIRAGEFILEYVGEVVSDQEFKQRMASRYAHDTHHYCLHLDSGMVIDGHRMGGDGRFVNHSCQPNCEMQKWSVNGQFRMALFALRDISPGEELTYDYNFSLFNPADGQVCKCGSQICRGVIGGKSQRVRQSTISSSQSSSETNNNQVGRVGRPRKNQARRATSGPKELPTGNALPPPGPVTVTPQVKPMSHQQKCFALQHHCFLLRNLDKVKRLRERTVSSVSRTQSQMNTVENNSMFLSQLNALRQPRNMRTRRLAQAQENPELNKAARLAAVLKDLLKIVTSAKDENQEQLCSPFITLPSKRKLPEYYQRITDPIDLTIIEQNIATGIYRTIEAFDSDMNKLFANSVRFFGRTSELGIAATRLRKAYGQGKLDCLSQLEDVLGEKAPTTFIGQKDPGDEEEDVIRCICGLYRDEGLMIQCERCLVWQHCECVRADPAAASYHCERCVPRVVDLEIPLEEFTEQGHRYYVSLMRGDLQLRQGDTVYVLRDIPIPGTDKKHTYDTVGDVKYTDLDIFRIERLWKDSKTGQRTAFGHHYLRPHETYHEPTRKFFPNEVMRVPLYEVVPIELIMSPCWVLDLNTYCKGRPLGATEDHVYICEYRVDKTARLFSKISKSKYPVCTKSYAFDRFDVRIKVSRTYTPHELDNVQVKPRGRRPHETDDQHSSTSKELVPTPVPDPIPIIRTREEQRAHLNSILLRLLGRLPAKHTLDVSYLLEGGRRRKKQQS